MPAPADDTTEARYAKWLLSKAIKNGDCLECHFKSRSNGYVNLREVGKAHRYVFSALAGPIGDLRVLHECDNRACINPKHLFLGTQKENVDDMMRKGRHVRPLSFKLTPEQVIEAKQLRAQGWIYRRIAARYGVTISTARNYIVGISSYASTSR